MQCNFIVTKVTHREERIWIGVPGKHSVEGDEESDGQLSCSPAACENKVMAHPKLWGKIKLNIRALQHTQNTHAKHSRKPENAVYSCLSLGI